MVDWYVAAEPRVHVLHRAKKEGPGKVVVYEAFMHTEALDYYLRRMETAAAEDDYDAHADDPLASCVVTDAGYAGIDWPEEAGGRAVALQADVTNGAVACRVPREVRPDQQRKPRALAQLRHQPRHVPQARALRVAFGEEEGAALDAYWDAGFAEGIQQAETMSYYYGKLFRGFKTGKTVRQVAKERKLMSDAELAKVLDARRMTAPQADMIGSGGG